MIVLRMLQAATVFAILIVLGTAWVFLFSGSTYAETLTYFGRIFGSLAPLWVGLFGAVSMVSTPLIAIAGLVGMALSRRRGRSVFMLGLLCCVLAVANFVLWKKYSGMPPRDSQGNPAVHDGITPVESKAQPKSAKP
jgi:hypothetical protein